MINLEDILLQYILSFGYNIAIFNQIKNSLQIRMKVFHQENQSERLITENILLFL
ncbi:hypothetical protein M153_2700009105 [Pseudoloma neurophilia]|uniref:Uncharacterized protein n=1 Tax=Pseudoloma neurophilia TaxID=146866 RepID=A0A0R0LYN8_9MICR|nr:hypothetical protein M153_2700009105 [Pseudoloma neurophilia]